MRELAETVDRRPNMDGLYRSCKNNLKAVNVVTCTSRCSAFVHARPARHKIDESGGVALSPENGDKP